MAESKTYRGRTERRSTTAPRGRIIAPHSLFFILYTALYFIPLWLVSTAGYGAGLVSQAGVDANTLMGRIIAVYAVGLGSFLLGSWSTSKFAWLLGETKRRGGEVAWIPVRQVDKIALVLAVTAFLVSKIVLIPTGVYSQYAFDSSMMDTATWSASMFFSEMLAFASLIALFSKLRHNVLTFAVLSLLNGVNLLHGTRNFFVTAMSGIMLYAYIRKGVSLVKLLVYGIGGFTVAVSLAYVVYLNREHAAFNDFSLLSVLSPITYESVFSQLSLITVLGHPKLFDNFGHVHRFVLDILIFTTPRFIIGNKGALLWTNQFAYLSPLGGFNGLALGLLYFGYSFPIAYFLLGLGAGVLQRMARQSFGAALYVYFCCDSLYRLQRDGYVIPAKMLINNLEVLCILAALHQWVKWVRLHRVVKQKSVEAALCGDEISPA